MTATPNELAILAKHRRLTIVFFPLRGEPHSLPPIALQRKYPMEARLEFTATAYEVQVKESANPIAPKPVAA